MRRSVRIQERDDRRVREKREREEQERNAPLNNNRVPKRLTRQPFRQAKKKKKFHHDAVCHSSSHLLKMPVDMILYLLEFLGPSLAKMEQASKSFYQLIRGPHSPYRFLYYNLMALHCPVDPLEIAEEERVIHAPVLPTVRKNTAVVNKDSRELKVSDWKASLLYVHKSYEVCTICGEAGDPIPLWEVRLCRFCVVRQLINKSALYAFMLSQREIEVLKPWKTYVYDLGIPCTFYLRKHLDHLRRQKWSECTKNLDKVVAYRQTMKFTMENTKRKRKQREQEEAFAQRTQSIIKCFCGLKLKPDLSVMDEWWFPKELKLEIHEYISNKTNNSLARKRLRLSMDQQNNNNNSSSSGGSSNSSNSATPSVGGKNKAQRKSLQEIVHELETVVVPRVERLTELESSLMHDGIVVEKLRVDLDLKTRRIYDDFILGNQNHDGEFPLTAARTRAEILTHFKREKIFEGSVHNTWKNSITKDDFLCKELEGSKFLRDAREWWARRGKKPPPERCGDSYLARVRKRQVWLKADMTMIRNQETWRRQLLERKLREKIDWYFTDLPDYINSLRSIYEKNLDRRMRNREIFWTKGLSTCLEMIEPPDRLEQMYRGYEDFIKNCNGFCQTDEGYCGCLEYAAKDIIRANTILRRKDWIDERLKIHLGTDYKGPEHLICPEAREEYRFAVKKDIPVPKKAAVMYIVRAEEFMKRLLAEVPTFTPEHITQQAQDCYKRCLGLMADFYDPPRRPSSSTQFAASSYFYTIDKANRQRPSIEETIAKIKNFEKIRLERLELVDRAAKEARLSPSFWNKAMVKRPMDGVTFQTRVRWIVDNGWFSLNQLAQAWVYDQDRVPLSQLLPFIEEKVKQMERDKRKEDIASRIKDDPEFQAIFKKIDEDAEFFLRASYEIGTIYKVSNLYRAHVDDVKSGIDPDKVVRQVVELIRDVKTGVISKSSLFVADREKFAEEDDDDDDDQNMLNGGNGNVINPTVAAVITPLTTNNNANNVVTINVTTGNQIVTAINAAVALSNLQSLINQSANGITNASNSRP
ncbi:5784_t:CDS:10 [Ambispora leptoticha]|uniref:5784_t:CDS:1 n=1 Tax=Ambispora leptoticha TaxID=144679 RepID=A0A9N9BFS8_9GLOM|nr:5784_t:CDS:10 [Ambispora leptoticha]